MKKRNKKKRIYASAAYSILVICFISVLIIIGKSSVSTDAAQTKEIYYKSVQIEHGDTLSSIAEDYGLSVDSLKELNNLESDTIYAGEYLIVSYTK